MLVVRDDSVNLRSVCLNGFQKLLHNHVDSTTVGSSRGLFSPSCQCVEVLAFTHGGADFVAHPEVEATLLVHGVVDAGEFGQLRPVVFEGVVQQAVVGAARERNHTRVRQTSNRDPTLFLHQLKQTKKKNLLIPFQNKVA